MGQLRMAKCTSDDLEEIHEFLSDWEEMMDNPELDEFEKMQWLEDNFREGLGRHWQRLIIGYQTLVANACDESLTYLDWKPELKGVLP